MDVLSNQIHQQFVIQGIKVFGQVYRAAGTAYSAEVLAYRLQAAMEQAKQAYPERFDLQCRSVGVEFNGRYSYGLMLERVCGFIINCSI